MNIKNPRKSYDSNYSSEIYDFEVDMGSNGENPLK